MANTFDAADWLARWQTAGGAFICNSDKIALLEPLDNIEAVSIRSHLRDEVKAADRREALRSLLQARSA